MHILYILNEFPCISETFILNEIIELKKLGHKVTIVSDSVKPKVVHKAIYDNNLLRGLYYIPSFYSNARKELSEFLKEVFLNETQQPRSTFQIVSNIVCDYKRLWPNFWVYFGYRVIKRRKIDIVYSSFSSPYTIDLCFLISRILQIPFVLTFRAHDIYDEKNTRGLMSRLPVIDQASGIRTISKYNVDHLKNFIGVRKELNLIHSGIDSSFFQPQEKPGGNKILCICRFVRNKGVPYLLEASKILQDRSIDHQIVIIGGGVEKAVYQENIKRLSLQHVALMDNITQGEIRNKLGKAALLVLPTIVEEGTPRDILPNVLKEAMSMQIPVITSRVSGIEELVQDNINGILVSQKDPLAIADTIEKLLKKPALREKLGRAGRKRVIKNFNIRGETKKLEKMFQGIVSTKEKV